MNKQRLVLRFAFIFLIGCFGMPLPTVGQTLPSSTLESREIAEVERLNQQVLQLYNQKKYKEAIPLAQRALDILEKVLGKNHPDVATSLNILAAVYDSHEKYTQAEPLYYRALAIYEKALGKVHPDVATTLNNLASLYDSQGKYTQAEPLYHRALAIREKTLGKDHPEVATSLNNLAGLYSKQRKYAQAEPLYQRALAILEKELGKDHLSVAIGLNNLAELYRNQEKYDQAESLYQRSLAIKKKTLGKDHPSVAISLNNLASLYDNQGKYAQAEPLYQSALNILEKVLGKDHTAVANSLNNLAELYLNQEKYAQAEPLYQRSLAIKEKVLGKDHPSVAISLNNLAKLYYKQGKYAQVELLYQNALTILEKVLGKDHPDVAASLNNLAELYRNQGKYAQAENLYQRALAIWEKAFGKDSRLVAISMNNLSVVYYNQRKYAQAVELHNQSSTIQEKELSRVLVVGSERDKQDYINNISTNPDASMSLAFLSNRTDADRLALTNVLRRQGRILDATAATVQSIRPRLKDRPDLQKLFDDWQATLQAQAALTNSQLNQKNPQEYQTRYQELEQRGQNLEAQLSKQSSIFRQTIAPIELEKIQTLIPQDAALIHIVRYKPFNPNGDTKNNFGLPRYAAAILHSKGNPHWVDLGAAAEIEKNTQKFREYLQDGSSTVNRKRNQIARAIDIQLMQPLRQHLGDAKHLLLSPDATLNLIPFEALKDENNKYLIERYTFSYLTSGRDLTRFVDSPPSRQAPVIFSEINYDKSTNFSPLNTAAETNEIQRVFPKAEIIRDRAATKAALQKIQAPSILHLATHGFFKPTQNNLYNSKQLNNPLIRSGIVLAGTDQLTGQEAYGLDLYGTQLIVLSACETGLGDISVGEGIYGLRRALVIAGSQSQVLSLWKVGDAATVELMKTFYSNLKTGMGRHEALRDAQLKLLRHPNYQNPYNWAAFIPSGNWKPLRIGDNN
jgi:CHAT domain-containing protein/sirohydrochlorin ferrochelatase